MNSDDKMLAILEGVGLACLGGLIGYIISQLHLIQDAQYTNTEQLNSIATWCNMKDEEELQKAQELMPAMGYQWSEPEEDDWFEEDDKKKNKKIPVGFAPNK